MVALSLCKLHCEQVQLSCIDSGSYHSMISCVKTRTYHVTTLTLLRQQSITIGLCKLCFFLFCLKCYAPILPIMPALFSLTNANVCLLCSKLCQHNLQSPIHHLDITCYGKYYYCGHCTLSFSLMYSQWESIISIRSIRVL